MLKLCYEKLQQNKQIKKYCQPKAAYKIITLKFGIYTVKIFFYFKKLNQNK